MKKWKGITSRKNFERAIAENDIAEKIWESLFRFEEAYGLFGGVVDYSPDKEDSFFGSRRSTQQDYVHTAVSRLYFRHTTSEIPRVPQISKSQSPGGLVQAVGSVSGEMLIGMKVGIENYKPSQFVRIGTTHNTRDILTRDSFKENLLGDRQFWPWDEIVCDTKNMTARMYLHGDSIRPPGKTFSKELLGRVYQKVLQEMEIPKGQIIARYPSGNHPIPVTYEKTTRMELFPI